MTPAVPSVAELLPPVETGAALETAREASLRVHDRRRPRRHGGFTIAGREAPATDVVTLAVVVPMFREASRIDATIATLAASPLAAPAYRLVFVDDGSDDGTAIAVARSLGRHGLTNASLLAAPSNRGKGAAVRLGVEHALTELDAEHIVYLDADLSLDPGVVLDALTKLQTGWYDAVVGRRRFDRSQHPLHRRIASSGFRIVSRIIAPTGVADTQCACKVFTASAAKVAFRELHTAGYSFDVEVLMRWRHADLRVATIDVAWSHQSGSKISTFAHAKAMLRELVAIRLVVRKHA
jgi:dolichyl-phosphate beta-glucosyltransferase